MRFSFRDGVFVLSLILLVAGLISGFTIIVYAGVAGAIITVAQAVVQTLKVMKRRSSGAQKKGA